MTKHDDKQTLDIIAGGLARLTDEELAELDTVITPRAAQLLGKAFGNDLLKVIGPLHENDEQEAQTTQPQATQPDETDLRKMIRDPRYWRERDPAILKQVQQGFERLYG